MSVTGRHPINTGFLKAQNKHHVRICFSLSISLQAFVLPVPDEPHDRGNYIYARGTYKLRSNMKTKCTVSSADSSGARYWLLLHYVVDVAGGAGLHGQHNVFQFIFLIFEQLCEEETNEAIYYSVTNILVPFLRMFLDAAVAQWSMLNLDS